MAPRHHNPSLPETAPSTGATTWFGAIFLDDEPLEAAYIGLIADGRTWSAEVEIEPGERAAAELKPDGPR